MKRHVAAVVLVVLASSPVASADDEVRAAPTAAELRRRGDDAMDARRAAEALELYRQAAALEPGPALDYNIGRALLATGDFAGALASFEKFQREAPADLLARTHQLGQIMTELEAKVATIEVTGTPVGAHVLVRGVEIGVLPVTARVNAGTAEVRVGLEGYDASVETFELTPMRQRKHAVQLRREIATGHLTMVVRPANAEVSIDGRRERSSPLSVDLEPGAHEVVIEAPSHRARRFPLVVVKDENRHIDITLDRAPTPLTKSAWFWAGVGVVVVSAIVTTVALTQTRSPDDGSLGTFHVP